MLQDGLKPQEIDDERPELTLDGDDLLIGVRLVGDNVAPAEEEKFRNIPLAHPTRRELTQLATRLYEARRRRDRFFDESLFGEPAWDMLLALYCLPARGEILTVTSLGYAANVPPSSATRWQKLLLGRGLIKRGADLSDARKQLVVLADRGRILLDRYFTRLFYAQSFGVPELDRS